MKKCFVADIGLRLAKKLFGQVKGNAPPPDLALPGKRQGFPGFRKTKQNTTTPDSADNRVIYCWRNGKEPPCEDVSGEEDDVEAAGGERAKQHAGRLGTTFQIGPSEDTSGRAAA